MFRTILSLAASLGAWSSFNGCTYASASEGPHPYYWDFPTSATITHDGGFGAPPSVFTIDPVPYTLSPPLQVSSTIYGVGGNESTAAAGIGRYCDSSLFAATFAQNMSLSQAAPAGGNTPASLKLEFFDNTVVVDGWSNLAGFYNLPLTGDIPLGSSVECILDFTVRANKVMYGELFAQHFALDWVRTDSGPFSTNLSDLVALPNIPAVDPNVTEVSLTIFGSLEFRVKNDGGPVSVVAPQGLQFQTSPVPEPGTFAMLGILGVCLGGYVWRKRFVA
jgi:hypothetical protein